MTRVKELVEATKLAHTIASPGDCVLLSPACASWDMFLNLYVNIELHTEP